MLSPAQHAAGGGGYPHHGGMMTSPAADRAPLQGAAEQQQHHNNFQYNNATYIQHPQKSSFHQTQTPLSANHQQQQHQPYHQWVEDKFRQYRGEIEALEGRIGGLQQQLAAAGEAARAAAQRSSEEREEDLQTISKLEKMVERFRGESVKVLGDHLKLQGRQQEHAGQQEGLKQRIVQLDGELRRMHEASAEEKASLEGALEAERSARRQLAAELKKATEQLAAESEARNAAEREAHSAQRAAATLESSQLEHSQRFENAARVVAEQKEQIRFLGKSLEEIRRSADASARDAAKTKESADQSLRAAQRRGDALEEQIKEVRAELAAAKESLTFATSSHAQQSESAYAASAARLAEARAVIETERAAAEKAADTARAERAALAAELAEASAEVRRLTAVAERSEETISELSAVVESLQKEKATLVDQLESHVSASGALCSKLAAAEAQIEAATAGDSAASARLSSLHAEVAALQQSLADVTRERETFRTAAAGLDAECADLQRRLGERHQSSADAVSQMADLSGRNDSLSQQMAAVAGEKGLLAERCETLEQRLAQLRAEKAVAEAEVQRLGRDLQHRMVAHERETEALRVECEQRVAAEAAKAAKQSQDALFEEQQRRQAAVSSALANVEADPRVRRAAETEALNAALRKRLGEAEDLHALAIADKDRQLRSAQSQLALAEREREAAAKERDREKAQRAAGDESRGDLQRSQHLLFTEFSIFTQSAEAWLREVLQKVALLTLQKVHSDFLVAARHRHEVFGLGRRLRAAEDRAEALQLELVDASAKADGLNESLQHEMGVSRELTARHAGRGALVQSPRRALTGPSHCVSDMALAAEAEGLFAQGGGGGAEAARFVLQTRWGLVTELCKQDLRCDVACEAAVGLFKEFEAAGRRHEGWPSIHAALLPSVADLAELVQSVANCQSGLSRAFLTESEKALLQRSKAAVL